MGSEQSWINSFLIALGIQPTTQSTSFVQQWIAAEGPWGTQVNPLNAGGPVGYNPQAMASWVNTNGSYSGLGTYGDELRAFFAGAQNDLTRSLSYWSGHSGNPVSATDSVFYNNPGGAGQQSGGSSFVPGAPSGNCPQTGSWQCTFRADCPNCWSPATKGIQDAIAKNNPIAQMFSTSIVFVGAIGLLLIGGIWLAMGNDTTRQMVYTASKRTAAAVVG